jgi:flagellar basal-body rod modification protein FlgD
MEVIQNAFSQFAAPVGTESNKKSGELGQDDFMRLMVTQLENQDPTKPMDNFEFLSQIAQFGMVSGIQESQQSLTAMIDSLLANRTLQATSLVGKNVVASSNLGSFVEGGQLSGVIELPGDASGVEVQIFDQSGQLVHALQLGPTGAGRQAFDWDGLGADGEPIDDGVYELVAQAILDGVSQGVPVLAASTVNSVSVGVGGGDVTLNLEGGARVAISDVVEFL